jgi:hypothetical protein
MHDELRERIDAAATAHERARKSLLRADGLARYAPAEHNELESVAQAEFQDKLRRVEDEISGRLESVEQRLQVEANRDPSSVLTAEELSEANSRRAFIGDEAFSLSPEALERRIRAVIAAGDRAGAFVYATAIRSMTNEADSEFGDSPADAANRLTLERLAAELSAFLDPTAEARREKLEEEIAELEKIKTYAYARRHGGRDLAEVYLNQAYGSTR